jgi:putative tricarboxylic transport membrane protein
MFSVLLVLVFGVVGWLMKELDLPMAPLVLGLVLGPLFEKSLVQTSALGQGSFGILLQSPISVGILVFAVLLMVGPNIAARYSVRRRPKATTPSELERERE